MAVQNMDFQVKNADSVKQARERLLDAAEKLFSEKGFDGIGIRELTSQAECNIAAVNYHFGSKAELYKQMFRRHMEKVFSLQKEKIKEVMQSEKPTLEKLLRETIKTALDALYEGDERIPMLKLTVREILNPHLKEEVVAQETVQEFLKTYREALVKLLPEFEPGRAMLSVFSLEGLILHPLLFFDFYSQHYKYLKIDNLVDHIVDFAAAGIRKATEKS